jgi:hypothetical protein
LVGGPEGRRPVGRPRLGWEDYIRIDLREVGIDGVNWIQRPMVSFCEHSNETLGFIKT